MNRCYAGLRKAKGQQAARTAFVDHFKKHLSISYMCRYDVPMEREWRTVNEK
ncbi:MAG: hypothetical protein HQ559_13170 [Lentisphaerae bacterium]|nr:hypothetical protein [Lentisphaerota bacterium]